MSIKYFLLLFSLITWCGPMATNVQADSSKRTDPWHKFPSTTIISTD